MKMKDFLSSAFIFDLFKMDKALIFFFGIVTHYLGRQAHTIYRYVLYITDTGFKCMKKVLNKLK